MAINPAHEKIAETKRKIKEEIKSIRDNFYENKGKYNASHMTDREGNSLSVKIPEWLKHVEEQVDRGMTIAKSCAEVIQHLSEAGIDIQSLKQLIHSLPDHYDSLKKDYTADERTADEKLGGKREATTLSLLTIQADRDISAEARKKLAEEYKLALVGSAPVIESLEKKCQLIGAINSAIEQCERSAQTNKNNTGVAKKLKEVRVFFGGSGDKKKKLVKDLKELKESVSLLDVTDKKMFDAVIVLKCKKSNLI